MTGRQTVPGLERWRAHLPDLRAARIPLIALIAVACFLAATGVLVTIDRLWPQWTLAGQFAVFLFVYVWVGQIFRRRDSYRARWGERAYQNAFARHVLPGMPVALAGLAHIAYMPGPPIAFGWARVPVVVAGAVLAISGGLLWFRSYFTFGVDSLALLYVYFPEEGRLVDSEIYSVIRHPVYSAVAQLCLAIGIWRGNWFSVAFALFVPIGLMFWLRRVEEPELIERFGEGYAEYRRRVPAYWPRPRDWGKFIRFLISGR